MREPAVGELARAPRRQRAGHAEEREQPDHALGEVVRRPGEQEPDARPDGAERRVGRRAVDDPPTQHRLLAQESEHRAQQRGVAEAGRGFEHRERPPEREDGHGGERGTEQEHRPPTQHLGHRTCHHPRQQHPDEQAGHHRGDRLTLFAVAGEVRGERHEDLRGDARQRDNGGCRREHGQRRAQRDADLAERGDREHRDDEAAALQEVAERYEQREAEGVGQLDDGEHRADRRARRVERLRDRRFEGLGVIVVRDDDAGGERHRGHRVPPGPVRGGHRPMEP